ncbi:Thioredoxin [Hyphodiscus hymeniophilus]|uniref:Thioredoxin n=1 Tax=Hyphodiscus hymeniophilus TaxID=353542 RepID=A0A9P7AYY4_9HELO|nr:Thioredoxin [Hyphodiscus hymeniophilus]
MSSTINIASSAEFSKTLSSSTIVVTDFYADWCGPCKQINPTYEGLSAKHSKPKRVTFTKVNVDNQQAIAQQYGVRAFVLDSMPTFLIFRSGSVIETIQGADPRKLTSAIENAVKLAGAAAPSYSTPGRTLGGTAARGQSLQRPFNFKGFVDAIIAFLGLYIYSLFSFDAYAAAENSPFNINVGKPAPGAQGGRTGAANQSGKKLGTIAGLSGGN